MNATGISRTPGTPGTNAPAAAAATASATKAPGRPRRRGTSATMGLDLRTTSTDGRRLAVAVLEVLAGARTPLQAAQAVGLSLPAYYKLEQRALEGLVYACEPRPPGRQCSPERELANVRKEFQRLHLELQRQKALTRAAQRALGLAPPAPRAASTKGKEPGNPPRTRSRRPTVRALKAVRTLQEHVDATPPEPSESSGAPPSSTSSAPPAPGLTPPTAAAAR